MKIFLRFVPTNPLRFTASRIILTHVAHYTRLAEVGKLEAPKTTGKYETGQLILHKVFGYRGVILFPWLARVYDRDSSNKKDNTESSANTETNGDSLSNVGKEVKGKTHTFYQVLIDTRDAPYIRAQTEAVTFLGNQESSRSLYAIPGLDYVAHDDIIPYASVERVPLQHELFDKFLMHNPDKDPPFVAQETLRAWQKKNHPWLELSDVHRETTEGVRVTVIPFYMGSRESQNSAVYWVSLRGSMKQTDRRSTSNPRFAVALLHPAGEPVPGGGAAARAPLAHILSVGHAGDSAGARRGGAGAAAGAASARLPVQQPRQPAGAQRTHVGHFPHGARGWIYLRLPYTTLQSREQARRGGRNPFPRVNTLPTYLLDLDILR